MSDLSTAAAALGAVTESTAVHARSETWRSRKSRPDPEQAPYRALNMYVATPAPKDITQLCLGRIVVWESEQGRRGRSAASIDKLKECTAEFLGALFQRAASCVVPDKVLLAMLTHAQRD